MRSPNLKIDVIINCFNYGKFIAAAIDSVLAQSLPAHKIIIINDGSTDDSLLKIQAYSKNPLVEIFSKENAGQLSCFNAAYPMCQGDIVAFLDADDTFQEDYLENLSALFLSDKQLACSFSSYMKIDSDGASIGAPISPSVPEERALRALYLHRYYGSPTSGIAFRKTALSLILPYPQEYFWRVCADDILVMSSSFLRLKSTTLKSIGFNYRIHNTNGWAGKNPSRYEQSYKRESHRILAAKIAPHLSESTDYFLYKSILREMLSSLRDNSFRAKDFSKIAFRSNLAIHLTIKIEIFIIIASLGREKSSYRNLAVKFIESRLLK